MNIKISDLKVGDEVIMTSTQSKLGTELLNKVLLITEISRDKKEAYTNKKFNSGHVFWVDDDDTLEYAIPFINEQKLKQKLGL